jgi:predicted dienelactone hydrolase
VVFRWTDTKRSETFTADPTDRRQVIAQAWYPTDATRGQAVPYFEAQGHLPSSIGGLPSFLFASFGSVATHATAATPVSAAQRTWPVLLFSPGLSVPREEYTALCADLASRGYVVVALSVPYESSVSVLAGGKVVGQTTHPDVMGPPPHPALERLIGIRAADSRFVLDQLSRLAQLEPGSPLAGHLDLRHVGIVGHSIGGATAVQVMAGDPRFKVGVDLDGKLFGTEPDAHLKRPFLWIQSDGSQTAEYTNGRDRFLAHQRGGGTLLLFRKSVHMSFSDNPAYLTSFGRRLIGGVAGVGSLSLADMTSMTGDTISAFVGPALGIESARSLHDVIASHPNIRSESRIGGQTTARRSSPTAALEVPAPTGAFHVGTRSIALVDPRIDAGADLDGVLFGGARTDGLSRPFMLMSAEPGFAVDPNRAAFWRRLRGPHYAVDIKGARHFAFSDLVFFAPELIRANASAGEEIRAQVGSVDGPAALAAARAYLLAFFDRFLRGKNEPLLTRTPGPFYGVRLTAGR